MTTTESTPEETVDPMPDHLVLYDGVCGLCGWAVRWLIDHDPHDRLMFAPLQGDTAARLGIEWDEKAPPSEASVVFVTRRDGERTVHHRSRAVAAAIDVAGTLPALTRLIRFTPRPIADLVYRGVAAIRYRVWGKHDECRIPSPQERERFLP